MSKICFRSRTKCRSRRKPCYNMKNGNCSPRKSKKLTCSLNKKICNNRTFPCSNRINSVRVCVKPSSFLNHRDYEMNPDIKHPVPDRFKKILSPKSKAKIENLSSYRIKYTGIGSSESTGPGPYYTPRKFCQILTSNFPEVKENCSDLNLNKLHKLLEFSGGIRYSKRISLAAKKTFKQYLEKKMKTKSIKKAM